MSFLGDPLFLRRIFEFLQRFGYINVGIFSSVTRKFYQNLQLFISVNETLQHF